MKKNLLFALTMTLGLSLPAGAAQPRRLFFPVRQSDGTFIEVRKCGNARFAFYATRDNMALLPGANGDLCYVTTTANGLQPTAITAHEAATRSTAEKTFTQDTAAGSTAAYACLDALYPQAPLHRATRTAGATTDEGLGRYGESAGGIVASIGAPAVPVIMAEFADCKFQDTTTVEKVTRWLNEKGYHDEAYCRGSVRDYFTAQSKGLFTPTFHVIGKVTLPRGYAYYGSNGTNGSIDTNKSTFIKTVVDLARKQGADFAGYADSNGKIPLVSIYFAGPGEQSSFEKESADYLWASFSESTVSAGDVSIASFFVGNELLQFYTKPDGSYEFSDPGTNNYPIPQRANTDGIGIFCHEFSHALGLPDFYYTGSNATVNDTLQTMSYWSVMDYGSYAYDGYRPMGYTAYERSFMGWLDMEDLDTPQLAKLHSFDDNTGGAQAYRISNADNPKEYYILENRQNGTWYPALFGHGLLITHVDYDATAWRFNTVNNTPARQRMAYIPANNVRSDVVSQYPSHLFPGKTGRTAFAGTLGQPLYGITETEGVISFAFRDETLTGIGTVPTDNAPDNNGACTVFSIDGRRVATLSPNGKLPALPAGLYMVVSATGSSKVIIK